MNSTLHNLVIYQFACFLFFLVYQSADCHAQQIIASHDEIRRTHYYRYLSAKGETTLLLNSREDNELDLFIKFSPVQSQPIYLVIFCYEKKVFGTDTQALIRFTDGTTLNLANTGKRNFTSMFLFDITVHRSKLSLAEIDKINLTDKSGQVSNDYYFKDHSDYFINFFNLYNKMKPGYQAIAISDTIQ